MARLFGVVSVIAAGMLAFANDEAFFERSVRPVLSEHCYACHTNSQLGGLRVDSRDALLKGGKSGPAIVEGEPDQSLLIQAVRRTHARLAMPPQGKLSGDAIDALEKWIKAGSPWPKAEATKARSSQSFWAFQPIRNAPDSHRASIDHYILAKLEASGLQQAKPAEKRVLIRRATFDLIGLPPTPDEIDAFVADRSPEAFKKVVERLLASPHYGERWARYWLDLARYADGDLGASNDTPYENAFRYRDWVVQALNSDMPYDQFVKAQIAADLMPDKRDQLLPGLGFQALGVSAEEQVDVTTRDFLGLTVGCAQCHDHKFDPIPTKDFYSLLGVFKSSRTHKFPLAAKDTVEAWDRQKKQIDGLSESIDDFVQKQSTDLGQILAAKTERYLMAAWKQMNGQPADDTDPLDPEILKRWIALLKDQKREYPFLNNWNERLSEAEARKEAAAIQRFALEVFQEKKAIDDSNYVKLGGAKGAKDEKTRQYTNVESLEPTKFSFWRDLASGPYGREGYRFEGGVYYFGKSTLDRFLSGEWKSYLDAQRAELEKLRAALPPQYPFLHTIEDVEKPQNTKIAIRGDAANLGEEAPRRFLQVLSAGEPTLFRQGSGRLEFAEAIASPANPLTARVMANRVWQWHFGRGIVPSASNFGQLGERPSHPELLDYLAARFIESGWSIKTLHREIMLSSTYQLSTGYLESNAAKDPDNRLLWRMNPRVRLDAEALRDAILSVAGTLDRTPGGPPQKPSEENRRRTLYTYIGRTKPDRELALFDFPNPTAPSEQRSVTVGPLQRLYFMNNAFVMRQAAALADRLKLDAPENDSARIQRAYRLLFGRVPLKTEIDAGLEFLQKSNGAWARYSQVLLASSEFSSVN